MRRRRGGGRGEVVHAAEEKEEWDAEAEGEVPAVLLCCALSTVSPFRPIG
jgi:hypothetical protein